jgi:hypothetical protein
LNFCSNRVRIRLAGRQPHPQPLPASEEGSPVAGRDVGGQRSAGRPPVSLPAHPSPHARGDSAERSVVKQDAASWRCAACSRPSPPPTSGRPPLSRPRSSSAGRGGELAGCKCAASVGWEGLVFRREQFSAGQRSAQAVGRVELKVSLLPNPPKVTKPVDYQ